ncbi:MAG: type II secretion system minor pseudopilin GspI [Xanthomonadales bacterium]|nr:type II secretion system minor pseudopilin GspI [Xanthomonadales bacterium]
MHPKAHLNGRGAGRSRRTPGIADGRAHCLNDSRFPIPYSRPSSGFTLLEVLIALAIVALALVALTRTAMVQVRDFDALRERTLASWVASNVLAETRLGASRMIGRSDGRVEFAGRPWRWTREIQATPNAEIRRVDIQVFAVGEQRPSATLHGFAAAAP